MYGVQKSLKRWQMLDCYWLNTVLQQAAMSQTALCLFSLSKIFFQVLQVTEIIHIFYMRSLAVARFD
jgi:hypothetical protein